eukprot:TRINITY_DN26650_c0_g1_i1.p1 TRINITY_DN26650_c0_g1~~TRINITY_DN26650_c0_g1_i1.p1  ORF type:complete len:107 (-),score=18.64 TRINITY_DN26650_c0_g1_i1:208-528(-)
MLRRPATEGAGPRPLPPPPPAPAGAPPPVTSLSELLGGPSAPRAPPLSGDRTLPPGPFLAPSARSQASEDGVVAATPPAPTAIPPAPAPLGAMRKTGTADDDNDLC